MNITYKKPTLRDIPAMQKLVAPEVETGVILSRSNDEIATNIRSYFLAMDGEQLVGFVALHIHSPALAELRSMIIDTAYRGQNIGSALVENACEEGRRLGLKEVLALTYQQRFFERLGFIEIPKESIPEHKIWADCIKCKHFPVCNEVSLIKTL
ncbi:MULTISPECIES: N-acetyltransferase [unclassified Sulfuricurvum]|uniref:N-acetyltransferase n=1 Tax=unclassified Sulfuricurvum TaxID=2632390 RepID=UPI0002998BCB|nr:MULTISPECIES: N-acetyltransferase [unclassified Sulfuricurvum]OHD81886.1 MAG: GNAT family N-acetyltransferase [Sulfuricurvum sp. RIFCSPHIGHO2_02_FULL_43_9]OHD83284.1 MAG: GNAT family N-acetyltransferase [Sulfuricurvum sp. RIFCSPHIGHO2_12_FULL_44_8]OHD83896.1 MAG: GNAT family N-acetyltransferase [Sulfuricurvum sp. RIFCSPLOWO2_02_43_6]OHD86540.1 MAG: GNAT family N-acetyltransferase [Sulfuricurvum sp. RIFCSPLOWO2_02_FULL_43_45]AFV97498.1 acetyltransferase [Candidatus Sulfuricurvum sp. RIFRC-1]